jgi:virulence-associated protein VapD
LNDHKNIDDYLDIVMHEIRIDRSKNRLYLTLGQIEHDLEVNTIISTIMEVVEQLRSGFTCLSDLREYHVKTRQDEQFMREIQEILWEIGVEKVVRISRDYCTDHFHFEQESLLWPAYPVTFVSSWEEGEAMLDGNR